MALLGAALTPLEDSRSLLPRFFVLRDERDRYLGELDEGANAAAARIDRGRRSSADK